MISVVPSVAQLALECHAEECFDAMCMLQTGMQMIERKGVASASVDNDTIRDTAKNEASFPYVPFPILGDVMAGEPTWNHTLVILLVLFWFTVLASFHQRDSAPSSAIADNAHQGNATEVTLKPAAPARCLHWDIVKFLCIWMVTDSHMYTAGLYYSPKINNSVFLAGFALVSGVMSKDKDRFLMSAQALRKCTILLLGLCLFHVMRVLVRMLVHKVSPSRLLHWPLPNAPHMWFILAIVCYRCLLTPLFNAVKHRSSVHTACALSVTVCVLAQWVMNEFVWQTADLQAYGRIVFYAPFYCIGLAMDTSSLENPLVKQTSIFGAAFFIVCYLTQSSSSGTLHAVTKHVSERITTYPDGLLAGEVWHDTILRLMGSVACCVALCVMAKTWCEASMPKPIAAVTATLAAFGSRTLTTYYCQAFVWDTDLFGFGLGTALEAHGLTSPDILGFWSYLVFPCWSFALTALFSSTYMDSALAWLIQPDWLVDGLLSFSSMLHGLCNGATDSA
jgi:hypothetical protein